MKKTILSILCLILTMSAFSQKGGATGYRTKHIPSVGTGVRVAMFDANGNLLSLPNGSSAQQLTMSGSTVAWVTPSNNYSVQTLSGTAVTWSAASGVNARITLTAATTITMQGLAAGMTGNLTVTNPTTAYLITLAGYANRISKAVYSSTNIMVTSGASKMDVYSWYYDGTNLIWNGNLDYK